MAPTLASMQPARYVVGLDVGQVSDPTALVIMEREMRLHEGRLKPWFLVRYMERIPLGTPYPLMVAGVQQRLLALDARYTFVIDHTGVGRPVFDLFAQAKLHPVGISITAGKAATQVDGKWDAWHVAKSLLVMSLQVVLQEGRFQVARSLPDAVVLVKEAQNFQWKVTANLNDQYGAWREGQHDDLLLAAACAVWYGELYAPRMPTDTLGNGSTMKAKGTGNPMMKQQAIRGGAWRR